MLQTSKVSFIQHIARLLLGGVLLFAGISHLTTARETFQAQVPDWVPLDADFVVVASGLIELFLGAGLVVLNKYRALFGWMTAAFFVAVFPGNIAQYQNRVDAFGLTTDTARFVRLFFQPVFVVWALWSTGAWANLRYAIKQQTRNKQSTTIH